MSLKQRKAIKLYSRLTSTPEPDIDAMDFTDAARCASLALSPLPLIFSYNSEKSLCGAAARTDLKVASTASEHSVLQQKVRISDCDQSNIHTNLKNGPSRCGSCRRS